MQQYISNFEHNFQIGKVDFNDYHYKNYDNISFLDSIFKAINDGFGCEWLEFKYDRFSNKACFKFDSIRYHAIKHFNGDIIDYYNFFKKEVLYGIGYEIFNDKYNIVMCNNIYKIVLKVNLIKNNIINFKILSAYCHNNKYDSNFKQKKINLFPSIHITNNKRERELNTEDDCIVCKKKIKL